MADMTMHLIREHALERNTVGRLYVDGLWKWFTLEDTLRLHGPKVYGETCIPAGKYQVVLTLSARFKRVMPLLLNVPGFDGVRIHGGNTDKDTLGCILVGGSCKPDNLWIGDCKPALDSVYKSIQDCITSGGKCWIEVIDPQPSILSTTPEPDRVPDPEGTRIA